MALRKHRSAPSFATTRNKPGKQQRPNKWPCRNQQKKWGGAQQTLRTGFDRVMLCGRNRKKETKENGRLVDRQDGINRAQSVGIFCECNAVTICTLEHWTVIHYPIICTVKCETTIPDIKDGPIPTSNYNNTRPGNWDQRLYGHSIYLNYLLNCPPRMRRNLISLNRWEDPANWPHTHTNHGGRIAFNLTVPGHEKRIRDPEENSRVGHTHHSCRSSICTRTSTTEHQTTDSHATLNATTYMYCNDTPETIFWDNSLPTLKKKNGMDMYHCMNHFLHI